MVAVVALTVLSHAGIGWSFGVAASDDLSSLKGSSSLVEEHCCSNCGVMVGSTVCVTGCVVISVVE